MVYDRYGSVEVLQRRDLPLPSPGAGEVQLRVIAAGLNPKDSFVRKGRFRLMTGARFPRQLGYDVSGVVTGLGGGTSGFAVGDEVYGMLNGWAGRTVADFVVAPASELALKPPSLSFEEAAAVPLAGQTALQALRDEAGLREGQSVLIHGASGGVGLFALQIARALGAQVTSTSSPANFELCQSFGAQRALDYNDPSTWLTRGYDVFFDVFGNRSLRFATPLLTPRGVFVSTVPSVHNVVGHVLSRFTTGRRARLVRVRSKTEDLRLLASLVERQALRPLLDGVWSFDETARAQAHIESKRTRGKVVISVSTR